jgi:hypothetical protein
MTSWFATVKSPPDNLYSPFTLLIPRERPPVVTEGVGAVSQPLADQEISVHDVATPALDHGAFTPASDPFFIGGE